MALTPHDIDRIAHLARLELSPQKSEQMRTQLNDFFGMVAQMQTVDTAGIEPLTHPVAVLQDVQLRLLGRCGHRDQSARCLFAQRPGGRARPVPGSQSHRITSAWLVL